MALKVDTIADHRERLNRVLTYIRENIGSPLRLETLAAIACFSPFHFHRIFAAHTGETLNDHIRRIRLENAAFKLCHSGESVTSIALAAGYETPAAFTKAFRIHFRSTPTEFRVIRKQTYTVITAINKSTANERSEMTMQAEIRRIPEQKVLSVRKLGSYKKAAEQAWPVLMKFAYSHRLIDKDTRAIGIGHDCPDITPEDKIRYDACITINKDVKTEGEVVVQTISGGRYAVFIHKGSYEKLKATYDAIFSQWLPSSGEKLRDVPVFETYLNRDPRRTKPENLKTEIWIPIE